MPAIEGWTGLQRREGKSALQWLANEKSLSRSFDALAQGLREILVAKVRTSRDARHVWDAAPSVLANCNEEESYSLTCANAAYGWLHLLDRYVRTWVALEHLLREGLLPMGKHGIHVLDVGSGPGPSAFATHDFYAALTGYAGTGGGERWRQPPKVTCVEREGAMNHFRHALSEALAGNGGSPSILRIAGGLLDFTEVQPRKGRWELEKQLRDSYDEWHDGEDWYAEPTRTAEEANREANAHQRYRLFIFSNFLTTLDTVNKFRNAILEILRDARSGSVVLLIGGKRDEYLEIGRQVGRLAQDGGFSRSHAWDKVASWNAGLNERLAEEWRWFYQHLRDLAGELPAENREARSLRDELEGRKRVKFGSSTVNAFRK